jgi:hypothetical protein
MDLYEMTNHSSDSGRNHTLDQRRDGLGAAACATSAGLFLLALLLAWMLLALTSRAAEGNEILAAARQTRPTFENADGRHPFGFPGADLQRTDPLPSALRTREPSLEPEIRRDLRRVAFDEIQAASAGAPFVAYSLDYYAPTPAELRLALTRWDDIRRHQDRRGWKCSEYAWFALAHLNDECVKRTQREHEGRRLAACVLAYHNGTAWHAVLEVFCRDADGRPVTVYIEPQTGRELTLACSHLKTVRSRVWP